MSNEIEVRPVRYNVVAASQTAQTLVGLASSVRGAGTGSINDILESVTIVPALAACGAVSIIDGTTTILTFPGGGTTALPTLAPFTIFLGVRSQNGAWAITTGASVSAIANGHFT